MSNHNLLRVMRPRHLRRAVLRSLIVSICASVAFAQQPRAIVDAPSTDRLRAHITYLASDKLEGRRTGSSGANLAAEYIAREFARYGLRQAHSPRRYLQTFPYVASVELGKGNVFSVRLKNGKQLALRVGEDWMPLALSSTARLEGVEGAFVNYGITATELSHNDYGGLTAKGRVALALSGTPDGDNPHGQFARYEDVRWKAIAARNAGAKALIIVAREDNFKDDRLSRLRYDNTAGDAGLPVLAISRQAASALLQLNNLAALTDLEKSISRFSLTKLAPPPGWSPERESWLIPSFEGQSALTINLVRREVSATNVVGILPGSDPKLKDEAIVIGAHYDHLGHGGAGSLAPREGEIHHGADDNASGVAGMLELARLFSSQQPRPRRTIVFIAFSGEEEGLLGSNYYVNHPVVPLANTVAMINMDMIGRLKNNNLVVGGVGTASELRSMIEAGNQMQGLRITPTAAAVGTTTAEPGVTGVRVQAGAPLVVSANGRTIVSSDPGKNFALTLNEDGFGPSDHSSFYAKQVPVLFFWTGTHDDYHKPSDTAEKINYDGEARIVSFVARIAQDIDRNDKRPGYTVAKSQSSGRGTGFRVYLGTIPNYADSNDGLKLDGVRDDSPAATSGLKAGDRIVKLAGREIKNVYDYTYALGEMKAGQEYEVEVVRGSERLSLRITPSARK